MSKFIDITGKKFGRLTAIGFAYRKNKNYYWKFKCDCGKEIITEKYAVMNKKQISCGCFNKESHTKERKIIYEGQKFGKLTVLKYLYKKNKKRYYKCICDCGNICIKSKKYLLYNNNQSCNCLKLEAAKKVQEQNCKTHGLSKTKLYGRYVSMKNRCYNKKNIEYKNYGGRGIIICDEWKNDFMSFYNWSLENGWSDEKSRKLCTLDRIDVNGNYCPENCRWVDMKTQNNNRNNNHLITIDNETKTLSFWLNHYNMSSDTFYHRKNRGFSDIDALTIPKDKTKIRVKNTSICKTV